VVTRSYRSEVEALIPVLRQSARALIGLGRADVADEIVHDVLVHALRTERNWLGEDIGMRLFSRLVTANRVRLRDEQAERRSGRPAQSGASVAMSDAPDASSLADTSGPSPLARLPLDEREALVVVVLGRLDHSLAAQALGIPLATLVTRLIHARDRLGHSLWRSPKVVTVAGVPSRSSTRSGAHLRLVKS
jgi:RNA polymerase sigma-70 factor, ECF subfamily